MHLVVDAANVVGSRPDGWWRDRAGAAARLVAALAAALASGALETPVSVVLEGSARSGHPEGPTDGGHLDVVHADRDGDSTIVALTRSLVTAGVEVTVVTADRALRVQVTAVGAAVCGPSSLLARL